MRNLLVGNGVTIEFGGRDYTNAQIIKRARSNLLRDHFPKEVYPKETLEYLEFISTKIPDIIDGKYDRFDYTKGAGESLVYFKNHYKKLKRPIKLHKIGLEDYFLVHHLVGAKRNIVNPDGYYITQSIRMMFLDSIYNSGEIQKLHVHYPFRFVEYLKSNDAIFTTNYDWNLEKASEMKVYYLHGAFHIIDDVYNPNSFRNRLPDKPFIKNNLEIPDQYMYLHSTALMAHSGNYKEYLVEKNKKANSSMDAFVKGYKENEEHRINIEAFKDNNNLMVRNLYAATQLKLKDPSLKFQENDALDKFEEISGSLDILGLSPYNDNHIFSRINENNSLETVTYYYYSEREKDTVLSILDKKQVVLKSVVEFWKDMRE